MLFGVFGRHFEQFAQLTMPPLILSIFPQLIRDSTSIFDASLVEGHIVIVFQFVNEFFTTQRPGVRNRLFNGYALLIVVLIVMHHTQTNRRSSHRRIARG